MFQTRRRMTYGMAARRRVLLLLAGTAFSTPAAGAAVLHVPGDFTTIQGCIDAASPGDECVVAPGTYNELINFNGKAITLRSSGGPDVTIIDAGPLADPGTGKPVVRCDSGEGADTVLDGFTLTGGTGDTTAFPGSHAGGGMFNLASSPTVNHCAFSGNTADTGAGMYNSGLGSGPDSSPAVTDCIFVANNGFNVGGGMFNRGSKSSVQVTRCAFVGNTATRGGGMYNTIANALLTDCTFEGNLATKGGGLFNNQSSPTVADCMFSGNSASALNDSGEGGAMANFSGGSSGSHPTVIRSTFSGNSADFGGGMFNDNSSPVVSTCTFIANTAEEDGGGMFNRSFSDSMLTDCLFSGNTAQRHGGGMYNHSSSPTLTRCTFSEETANQRGGGMYNFSSSPMLIYCTIRDSTSAQRGGGMYNDSSSPTLTNCAFFGNTTGQRGGGMFNFGGIFATANRRTSSGTETQDSGNTTLDFPNNSAVLTNCTFIGNTATEGVGRGGGIYNASDSPTLTHCTFFGNSAPNSGGGLFNIDQFGGHSAPVLNNCILWGNAPNQILDSSGAAASVRSSDVQGAWPGAGNIDAEPMFVGNPSDGGDGWGDDPGTPGVDEGANDDVGDLRLLAGSPCIDTGDSSVLPADDSDLDGDGDTLEPIPFDLDGHARVLCAVVDMGAYESGIGDDDCDQDVDLGDFGAYVACLSGPEGGLLSGCEVFDFDGDGDVDLIGMGAFQVAFTGSP